MSESLDPQHQLTRITLKERISDGWHRNKKMRFLKRDLIKRIYNDRDDTDS